MSDAGSKIYTINLNGNSKHCTDGVVCLKSSKNVWTTLGTKTSAQYFINSKCSLVSFVLK